LKRRSIFGASYVSNILLLEPKRQGTIF